MDLDIDEPEDNLAEHDSPWTSANYTPWEEECIKEVEDCGDLERQTESEKDMSKHKLWHSFQTAACNIAQLYKDRHQGVSLWLPFQNAAGSVTTLYRDCMESQKRISELSFQSGSQRRNKEILAWLKKRKRNIRRDELIAFLCGKNIKSTHNHHHNRSSPSWGMSSPRQRLSISPEGSSPSSSGSATTGPNSLGLHSMRSPHHNITLTCLNLTDPPVLSNCDPIGGDLQTFRDALALSAVAGIRNTQQSSINSANPRRNSSSRGNPQNNSLLSSSSLSELNAFITEEYVRHVEAKKRSSSSTDVIMDSPTQKKPKFL